MPVNHSLYKAITNSRWQGDGELAVKGSGIAVPIGLEATFSYNGLVMNDLTVYDKYRVMSIDGLADSSIRDSREDKPGDDGQDAYTSYYSGRTIVMQVRVEAYGLDKLRDMEESLRTAFIDMKEKPLYFLTNQNNMNHYINCKKSAEMSKEEDVSSLDYRHFRTWQITLTASDPRFYRVSKNYINTLVTVDEPEFNNDISFESASGINNRWVSDPNNKRTSWLGTDHNSTSEIDNNYANTRRNYAANPRAAVNATDGWSFGSTGYTGAAMIKQNTSLTQHGTSFSIVGTKVGATPQALFMTTSPTNSVPAAPGEIWTASAVFHSIDPSVSTSAARGFRCQIQWYDAGNSLISTDTSDFVPDEGVAGTRIHTTATAPALTAFVAMRPTCFSETDGDFVSFRVWDCLLEKSSEVGTYFDGSGYYDPYNVLAPGGSVVSSISTDWASQGTKSLKVVSSYTNPDKVKITKSFYNIRDGFAYSFSGNANFEVNDIIGSDPANVIIKLNFFNLNNTSLGSTIVYSAQIGFALSNSIFNWNHGFIAPSGCAKITMETSIEYLVSNTGWTLYLDELSLRHTNILSETGHINIENLGNYNTSPIIIIGGEMENITVINESAPEPFNNIKFKPSIVINEGDVYIIDVDKRTIVDQNGVNKINELDMTSGWLKLYNGPNTITLSPSTIFGSSTESQISFEWKDAWI